LQLYERSLKIQSFKTLEGAADIDLNAPVGTTYQLAATTVTIIDPFAEYVSVLKECFDFDALSKFLVDRPEFSMVFDGMHGAGGPFAQRVLVEELGLPEVRVKNGARR
jgi:phosphoglucomutase